MTVLVELAHQILSSTEELIKLICWWVILDLVGLIGEVAKGICFLLGCWFWVGGCMCLEKVEVIGAVLLLLLLRYWWVIEET